MARFAGAIGYDLGQVESAPDVWTANVVERKLKGDIRRDTRQVRDGENLNPDFTTAHMIEVVADEFARENYAVIRYAIMNGVRWVVESVEVKHPRLVLRLGRRYNGPIPPPAP